MKNKVYVSISAVIVTTLLVICSMPLLRHNGPVLLLNELCLDEGKVDYNQIVNFDIKFKNSGNSELKIISVTPSCKCLMKDLYKRSYQPGESGQIAIDYVANKKPGEVISQTITICSNDANRPVQKVELRAEMADAMNIFPRELEMGAICVGASRLNEIIITPSKNEKPFDIFSISTTVENLEVDWSPLKTLPLSALDNYRMFDLNTSFRISVKMSPRCQMGDIKGAITIKTSSVLAPIVSVPVTGKVVSSFRIDPPKLLLSAKGRSETKAKTVTIENKDAFTINGKEDYSGPIKVGVTRLLGNKYLVSCELINPVANDAKGVIEFDIEGHPYEKRLYIPYFLIE